MKLSRRQRQILYLMLEHGPAQFCGYTRKFYWQVFETGLVIQAYQTPEYFLCHRGLIARYDSNVGVKYVLTETGREVAASIKEMPK